MFVVCPSGSSGRKCRCPTGAHLPSTPSCNSATCNIFWRISISRSLSDEPWADQEDQMSLVFGEETTKGLSVWTSCLSCSHRPHHLHRLHSPHCHRRRKITVAA